MIWIAGLLLVPIFLYGWLMGCRDRGNEQLMLERNGIE